MKRKKIGGAILLLTVMLISVTKTYAVGPTFSFYPQGGIVANKEEGFTVDVLIDSGTEDISKARMTITFDPEIVQLTKAMRNETLFEEWPEDESTTDNENGIIMLTGVTHLGSTFGYYNSSDEPDVFARLEFNIINPEAEDIVFDFEFNGSDELFQTVIINETSNVLLSKPESATFSLSEKSIPETALNLNLIGPILGLLLILIGGFVRKSPGHYKLKKKRTVVFEE